MHIEPLKGRVSPEEWQVRVDLAALYRLTALYGWSDLVFTHISARVPGADHHFLINPYGMLFEEITASSLVKVDADCVAQHDTPFPVNPAGFTIHSCIHAARPEVQCVMHTHTRAGVAVSAQKGGLLPISQQATLIIGDVAYHDYEGVALRNDERPRLQADLGTHNLLILRNHGLLTTGRSIPGAFLAMYFLETACQIQIAAQAGGDLVEVPRDIQKDTVAVMKAGSAGQGPMIAWPALMRKLDRIDPSFRD